MSRIWLLAAGRIEERSELITARFWSDMAVSTSEPLCQPCAYNEAFKGKSQHYTLVCFCVFLNSGYVENVLLLELNCASGGVRHLGKGSVSNTPADHSPLVPNLHHSVDLKDGRHARWFTGCGGVFVFIKM